MSPFPRWLSTKMWSAGDEILEHFVAKRNRSALQKCSENKNLENSSASVRSGNALQKSTAVTPLSCRPVTEPKTISTGLS